MDRYSYPGTGRKRVQAGGGNLVYVLLFLVLFVQPFSVDFCQNDNNNDKRKQTKNKPWMSKWRGRWWRTTEKKQRGLLTDRSFTFIHLAQGWKIRRGGVILSMIAFQYPYHLRFHSPPTLVLSCILCAHFLSFLGIPVLLPTPPLRPWSCFGAPPYPWHSTFVIIACLDIIFLWNIVFVSLTSKMIAPSSLSKQKQQQGMPIWHWQHVNLPYSRLLRHNVSSDNRDDTRHEDKGGTADELTIHLKDHGSGTSTT